MEEYHHHHHGGAAHYHPFLHAAGRLHLPSSAAAAWDDDPPHQLLPLDGGHGQDQDLRDALLRALGELDAARAELRRAEAERDEIRRHYHSLLLLLHHHSSPPPGSDLQNELQGIRASASSSSDPEEGNHAEAEAEKRLPEKGRLVEAVVSAGPLLQTLLLAGPLPRWRRPPPPADALIPRFNPNSSFSSASSPESDNCAGGGPALSAVAAQQDALPCFRVTSAPFCI